jgi:beta-galactosidase/beta-glucuronidase
MKLSALVLLAASTLAVALAGEAQPYTRGIGVYPGDPKEYMGPSMARDAVTYRNLALHRPAYQSSAYDYNLTAQLVTDGIRQTALPQWIVARTSSGGLLGKRDREVFLDGNPTSMVDVTGDHPWVEFALEGGEASEQNVPEIDHFDLYLRNIWGPPPAGGWTFIVSGSDDQSTWKELGRVSGTALPPMNPGGASFRQPIDLDAAARFRAYRIEFVTKDVRTWGVAEVAPFFKGREVHLAGPDLFSSAWMSAGSGTEWVYVDLGANCAFDRVKLAWIRRAAEGEIQVSDDAAQWKTLQPLPVSSALDDDIRLAQPAKGRYVRVSMTRPAEPEARYILSEVEVWGRGGPIPVARAAAAARPDGALPLDGGKWRLQRASLAPAGGEQLSTPGFKDQDWMIATVPGTVLTSYLNDGAIVNPDFGDNQYAVSDSFFCADFWYRDEFVAPVVSGSGQHRWLNFDGINWKAEVYLNGHRVGRIDGGYMRGRFDVTALVRPGAVNALAVRILRNDNPGGTKDKEGDTVNGGALGRDNPTYHASAGWDWMSTIRGRNTGIWSNVALTTSGAVTIEDPLVTTTLPLPDTTHADVSITATLRNQEATPVSGVLRARFGTITVETPVTLEANAAKIVQLGPSTQPALRVANPKLWWPVGYGEPNLNPVNLSFVAKGKLSDSTSFKAGIRQFTYSEDGGVLKIWVNGRRFIARGGNWGFPESMLRYRAREYDTALAYHRDQHFNMIRNWVGQTGDEAFYDAADRYGVVIWQDFWLANPWDGQVPDNNDFFLTVAKDYLLRIRNHASLGLFCGRNEGNPPKPIDDGLRSLVGELRPGSHYISASASTPVSGGGPYRVEPLKYYFQHSFDTMHSEIGAPNVPEMPIMDRTMLRSDMWPEAGPLWLLHDFYPQNPFKDAVEQQFGGASNIEEWDSLAQFVDYNAYRGMFEGQSKNRLGVLIWMSHPAWPSLLWQTYDYFFDTDAAYYGAKKAAEPLHIQWNAAADTVEVVNSSAGDLTGLTARAELLDIDGAVKWQKSAILDSKEDSTLSPIPMEYPEGLSRTHFIRLSLERDGKILSSNFYLHGNGTDSRANGEDLHGNGAEDYRGLRGLPVAKVSARSSILQIGGRWKISTELQNTSSTPALMVRIKAVREKSGDPILPALYDDNYIALMPGESRTIHAELLNADTRGERPRIQLEGYNLAAVEGR